MVGLEPPPLVGAKGAATLKPHTKRLLIEAMAKHLPPSGSTLRLWDIGGNVGEVLAEMRDDLDITPLDTLPDDAPPDAVDSIVALDYVGALDDAFLRAARQALRPGGRLIMVDTNGDPDKSIVQQLEDAGHTRILVEPAAETPEPLGVLMRGEKPHTTDSTFARIKVAAQTDADNLTLATFDGPYVFLLVAQTPNKPVWALKEGETLTWRAVTIHADDEQQLLAFTSLPKAVSFMQPAVMQGVVTDINKVGKFSRATASTWDYPVRLNPTLDTVRGHKITLVPIDPDTAEAPDE
jgi:hypothetical protein